MKKQIDLDRLQTCAERMLVLLKARQPGLMSWNTFLYDRVEEMRELIEEDDNIDLSDIPEAGEEFFKRARLVE